MRKTDFKNLISLIKEAPGRKQKMNWATLVFKCLILEDECLTVLKLNDILRLPLDHWGVAAQRCVLYSSSRSVLTDPDAAIRNDGQDRYLQVLKVGLPFFNEGSKGGNEYENQSNRIGSDRGIGQ